MSRVFLCKNERKAVLLHHIKTAQLLLRFKLQLMLLPSILHIETSTTICSVALSIGDECIFSVSDDKGMNHAALLSVYIAQAMDTLSKTGQQLNAVAISSGPGSYTGLRIGVSTAKGMCYGMDIPLIAVSTLQLMAISTLNQMTEKEDNILLCPMIDARRMEVYAALFNSEGTICREIAPDIVDETTYQDFLATKKVYFFGNGSDKCKSIISHENAVFLDDIHPLAYNMIPLALDAYSKKLFVDTAYFEPFYLKEFQTTTPKKQMI